MDELELQAYKEAMEKIRKKVEADPCYLCERIDCAGCEHFK